MTLDEMLQISSVEVYGHRVVTVEAAKMIAVEHAKRGAPITVDSNNYRDQVRVSGGMSQP
jgi:hypothetical protein